MTDYRVHAGDIREDQATSAIETFAAQIPSSLFLAAAGASIVASAITKATCPRSDHSLFFGQWVAPFLLLGIYVKMVKQHGSDAESKSAHQAAYDAAQS